MKIATLTLHKANNYGAKLQAYALQRFILDLGFETELINFYPNQENCNSRISIIKKIFHYAFHLLTYIRTKRRTLKFNEFDNVFLKISKTAFFGDDQILRNPPQYDAYIVGSDQIWNASITNNSKTYYLHFINNRKKIAYGGSFGKAELTVDEIQNIRRYLANFDYLSVREKEHMHLLRDVFGLNVQLVLDPVFLLSREQWNKISAPCKLPSRYILVYILEYSDKMISFAKNLAKELKCEVVYVSLVPQKINGKVFLLGPREYLHAFINADYVCTNSFHGIAFSILFEKNFTAFKHSSKNLRIDNILQLLNLTDRYYDFNQNISAPIDYNRVNEILNLLINASKDFIISAIRRN